MERLEARMPANKPGMFRSGYLTRLPEDHTGERHVVVVKPEPVERSPGHAWCEFEERPGPAPPGSDDGGFTVYLTR
jgi:hypothetical protein